MITVKVTHNFGDVIRMLDDVQRKQVPFATAKALTLTAKNAEKAVYAEMRQKFDRPTPMTMKSLRTKPATKRDLTAMVYLKDQSAGGKSRSMLEVIGHEFSGGDRNRKRLELWLQRAGLISQGEFVAPGQAVKLDQYGNMSRGQIQQIMSQLRLGLDPYSWKSKSARSTRNVKRAGEMFWSRGGRFPRGVWMRAGASVKPILIVVSKPHYKQRIDMDKIARRVIARDFDGLFARSMSEAMRTAR